MDTNVVSELRKDLRAHQAVQAWRLRQNPADMAISVLVLGEIRVGIERLRPRDPQAASLLQDWLMSLPVAFRGRVLPFDAACADAWGRLTAFRSVPREDAMMVATAQVYGLTLVTRNKRHTEGLGVPVLDPFE